MNYFVDTEFHEYQKQPVTLFGIPLGKPTDTIELISIGIVDENEREFYAICKDFDLKSAWQNEWLKGNVLQNIYGDLITNVSVYEKTHFSIPDFSLNGLQKLLNRYGKTKEEIAEEIVGFIYGENKKVDGMTLVQTAQTYETNHPILKPEFYGYYCDYDWVVFCWLFGRMIDLPKGFPMYCRDLKQMLDESADKNYLYIPNVSADIKNHSDYPKQENEHNALADARWNKELYGFIQKLAE